MLLILCAKHRVSNLGMSVLRRDLHRNRPGQQVYVKRIEAGVIKAENHLGFLQQADGRKWIGSKYDGLAVILIKRSAHIYPQIPDVRRKCRVYKKCECGSVKDKWSKWRRAGTKEGRISLLIQLGDDGLWLMLGNLKKNVLREWESIGAVQGNDDMGDRGTQDNLRCFRIKPPVEFRVVQIGVAGNEHLPCHGYDLLNQGNDRWIFADRKRQVRWRRDLQNSYFVRIAMDSVNHEIYRILSGRLCVLGKPIGSWNQVIRSRLRTRIRADIINGLAGHYFFEKERLKVM